MFGPDWVTRFWLVFSQLFYLLIVVNNTDPQTEQAHLLMVLLPRGGQPMPMPCSKQKYLYVVSATQLWRLPVH